MLIAQRFAKSIKPQRFFSSANKPKLIIISGTTGSGKSFLATQLANEFKGEIVSVDSVKVYKGLDIGSNKKSLQRETARCGVSLHLVDTLSVTEEFSTGDFVKITNELCKEIVARGNTPILVGGSSFYMTSFFQFSDAPKRDPELTKQIERELEKDGSWQASLERLRAVDPESASKLLKNDYLRLVRALEIYQQSGKPRSSFKLYDTLSAYDVRGFFITSPRNDLFRQVDRRCEAMISKGFLKEVHSNFQGIDVVCPPSISVGYKEALEYIMKAQQDRVFDSDFMRFLSEFQAGSRQLLTSQLTWYRNSKAMKERFLWTDASAGAIGHQYGGETRSFEEFYAHIRDCIVMARAEFEEKIASTPDEAGRLSKLETRTQRSYRPVFHTFDQQTMKGQQAIQQQVALVGHFHKTISPNIFPQRL